MPAARPAVQPPTAAPAFCGATGPSGAGAPLSGGGAGHWQIAAVPATSAAVAREPDSWPPGAATSSAACPMPGIALIVTWRTADQALGDQIKGDAGRATT